jgi:hypothetical protein
VLLTELVRMEEAPWGSYYGRQLDARDLAGLLRHYDVSSTNVRMKDVGEGRDNAKGYRRDDLYEVWERYL